MGQFEYSVGLSPVKPEDIERVAKEYMEQKERDKMIKHEHGMLVLSSALSKADQEAINAFIHESLLKERKRILDELMTYLSAGSVSLALFKLKQIVNQTKEVI